MLGVLVNCFATLIPDNTAPSIYSENSVATSVPVLLKYIMLNKKTTYDLFHKWFFYVLDKKINSLLPRQF